MWGKPSRRGLAEDHASAIGVCTYFAVPTATEECAQGGTPMAVSTICTHPVATIARDADVLEAAARMREQHVGDLVVVEYRQDRCLPVGILTDRDIVVSVVAKQIEPRTLTVGDIMSRQLLTVHEDNGIEFALREMRRAGVRRAPVVDANGGLTGVLSIDDVIDHVATALGHIADIIRLEQQVEISARP
jgi:predicted transcriptional regulator